MKTSVLVISLNSLHSLTAGGNAVRNCFGYLFNCALATVLTTLSLIVLSVIFFPYYGHVHVCVHTTHTCTYISYMYTPCHLCAARSGLPKSLSPFLCMYM